MVGLGQNVSKCYNYPYVKNHQRTYIPMSKITNGHIIAQNLDGTDHLDCLYRISLKALIYNDAGQILVVKEIDRTYWDLPGGGMDFGETIESSLKRELYEEVGYKGDLRYQLFDAS